MLISVKIFIHAFDFMSDNFAATPCFLFLGIQYLDSPILFQKIVFLTFKEIHRIMWYPLGYLMYLISNLVIDVPCLFNCLLISICLLFISLKYGFPNLSFKLMGIHWGHCFLGLN